jgi:hypothetical protein
LSAPYTSASQQFRPSAVLQGLGAIGTAALQSANSSIADREALQSANARGGRDEPGDRPALVTRERGESLARLLAIVALFVAAAIVALKLVVRRSRFVTRDPRRVAGACRRELADFLVDQGIHVSPSATLPELADVISAELAVDAATFVRAASAARFAQPRRARASAVAARRELHALERAIRRRLSLVERARGLLSLRSLGFAS